MGQVFAGNAVFRTCRTTITSSKENVQVRGDAEPDLHAALDPTGFLPGVCLLLDQAVQFPTTCTTGVFHGFAIGVLHGFSGTSRERTQRMEPPRTRWAMLK